MNIYLIVLMSFVAAASGIVGSFALHRRMSLVADAFSHVALPGIGLAFLAHSNPLYGGIIAILLGAIIIWFLEERSQLPTENIVGIIFIFSLALGAILTPEGEILEALFGGTPVIGTFEFAISILLSFIVIVTMLIIRNKLTLISLSPEIAQSIGIKKSLYNFIFLIVFSLAVILGLKFLGILLMGALIIIPAAISKIFSWNQKSDMILSQVFAIVSVNGGLWISHSYRLPLGPTIALVCFGLFIVGLVVKQLVWKK